jgi:tRNA (guanine37-N1)-methyltransferase
MNRLCIALLHHPVVDRHDQLYTTAITNIDVHDIARSSCTYGLDQYYLVSPITAQRELGQAIADFWISGTGHRRNKDRARAMGLVNVQADFQACVDREHELTGQKPLIIATSAKLCEHKTIPYPRGTELIKEQKSTILVFGTGYGLAPEILDQSDFLLEPIYGRDDYNHLSVRSAAAIILDRLVAR